MQFQLTNTDGKIEKILKERGVNLLDIKEKLDQGDWLAVYKHPSRDEQIIYVVEIDHYCWLVPVVKEDLTIKTAFPSRKMTKKYVGNRP